MTQRGQADSWRDVGVPAVTAFLSWLRNGRTVEHSITASGVPPTAATMEARLAALISFYRWHEAVPLQPGWGRLWLREWGIDVTQCSLRRWCTPFAGPCTGCGRWAG
ncbi:hypothetical protein [Antrihabitans sp. YC2-6]|uniref:hypothetical protein n=1 Tax=Antrihabitans sp. YC2-6 TaxID=2799498 RepID=UPI0027DC78C7|nr:hypothetical protein [Antrihabitans sp. YC2-6]